MYLLSASRGERMSVEIIYEKKYPRIDPMEEMKQIEMEMADEPEEPTPSFDEIMQKIQENTTYVLMPERIRPVKILSELL